MLKSVLWQFLLLVLRRSRGYLLCLLSEKKKDLVVYVLTFPTLILILFHHFMLKFHAALSKPAFFFPTLTHMLRHLSLLFSLA